MQRAKTTRIILNGQQILKLIFFKGFEEIYSIEYLKKSNPINFPQVILNVMWLLKSSIDQNLINHISNLTVILKAILYLG